MGGRSRGLLAIATALLAGLLGLSVTLRPDPRGYGTHTQLGLRPCAFATVTGRLCPTCGMTTAFAWFVRGRIHRSWRANPAGCLIAATIVPTIFWLLACVARGAPVGSRSISGPLVGLLFSACVLGLSCWLIRWTLAPKTLTAARVGTNPPAAAVATGP